MASDAGLTAADLPPYQLQSLIDIVAPEFIGTDPPVQVLCVQASGTEIYAGCSNGDLLRFALQVDTDSQSPDSYTLLSRQSVPSNRPVDDIILIPSLSRALVLSDRQVLVYTLPVLDMIPSTVYKPIRHVMSIAVDEQELKHLASRNGGPSPQPTPVQFCVIKRQSVSLYHLREKPVYDKDIPLPSRIHLAKRSGRYICVADHENYSMIDLQTTSLFPFLPISQAPSEQEVSEAPQTPIVKPFIIVISGSEFLILSWTGASTLGLFITGEGDPVRGTLEWSSHPISVAFDDPYVTTLLPDGTVEIHSIETQALVQTVPAPLSTPTPAIPIPTDRKTLLACAAGFSVPSAERQTKLRPTPVKLRRPKVKHEPEPGPEPELEAALEPEPDQQEQEHAAAAPTDGGDPGQNGDEGEDVEVPEIDTL